jgi:hypothetical protein
MPLSKTTMAVRPRPANGPSCPVAVICPTSSENAARPLLTQAVAIGDCRGQELNRRNLHDPALSPAQVEPRPRGLSVACRQTMGSRMAYLIGGACHWFGGRVSTRARRTPVYLDDHTPRDIDLARMEYHFLHMPDPVSAHDAGGADQAKRPIARVGEDQSLPSRIGLDLVWNNPN